jgi:endonuclease YncB( thermonuclease family)
VLTEVVPKEPSIVDTCLYAYIAKVVDGETVAVQAKSGAINVRLWGVDCPNNNQWGKKARDWLQWRIEHKDVALEIVTRDKHGRAVVRIYQGGSDVGLQMLALGLAQAAPGADNVMAETARAAKAHGIGMWGRK